MNTLVKDFNEFVARRLSCAEANVHTRTNEAADSLIRTLNSQQLNLFLDALNFQDYTGSILEENAYRLGFLDGLSIISSLKA